MPRLLRLSKYTPYRPSIRQIVFLSLPHREAFYGGAARGGKSSALLLAALQYVDKPAYSAILFRRTMEELHMRESLIPLSHEWLAATDARWQEAARGDLPGSTWHFPSGATVSFSYLAGPRDHLRHQSAAYQYIGFDELTHFEKYQYEYLFSRLVRREGVQIPLRMRSASNPGGPGHQWVKERFVDPGTPQAPFVPAYLDDNPGVDAADYRQSISRLDPITRRQLEHGDWTVTPAGGIFDASWFEVVPAAPADLKLVRYWDLAATAPRKGRDPDYTAGCLLGRNGTGTFYLVDMRREQYDPAGVESLIKQTAAVDAERANGNALSIRIEQEPGASGKMVGERFTKELAGYDCRAIPSTGSKQVRAMPVAAQASVGNIKLVSGPWVGAFLDEVKAFPQDGFHDDQVDALSGALAELAVGVPYWQDSEWLQALQGQKAEG